MTGTFDPSRHRESELRVQRLRRAPDAGTAYSWEVIIHLGIVVVPVFYFHFVLIFLERTTQHRPALTLAYTLAAVFVVADFTGLLMTGVTHDFWGIL